MSCLGATAETTHLHVLFQALMSSLGSLLAAYGSVPPAYIKDVVSETKIRQLQRGMQLWGQGFKADSHCSDKLSLDHVLVRSPEQAAKHARELVAITGDLEIRKFSGSLCVKTRVD